MTSSWALTKRKEMADVWNVSNFGNPENSLGGWEDHYIINGACRECHPDFEAIPIGNPYGFMVCKRRKFPVKPNNMIDASKYPDGMSLDVPHDPIDPSQFNGYNKYMADMYRPWRTTQIQLSNPYNYYDRTTPNEALLHQKDYLAREIYYSGNGIKPVHTPGQRKYSEYGYSFTNSPPYKYDVTRLHQAYPVWKDTQIYHGDSQEEMDKFDQVYDESVPASTW
uniref:Uncharacterized protein n=1 Tax=Marseillevirus LCMAC102 TaxID=2506603 RepID=A0A481YTN9_9VIRU|nr:MAG: uncharacterized protein LCMAC102_01850 [Marseillevirus LCMAC102]